MNEKDVNLVLEKSEEICNELNLVFAKNLKGMKDILKESD